MARSPDIPSHIPKNLVHDVDVYDIPGGGDDPFLAWSTLQAKMPDIYWTPRYGGHWIFNRARFVAEVAGNWDRFSYMLIPDLNAPLPPLTIEPEMHHYFRKPLSMALLPAKVRKLSERVRQVINERIDSFIESGECEFMSDVASYVPVAVVLGLFDLPFEDRPRLQAFSDAVTHSSDEAEREAAVQGVFAYSDEWVRRRKIDPGDDLISQFLNVQVGDRAITHDETVAMTSLLLLGGLDTVTYTMGAIMRFLAESPAHVEQLVQQPGLIGQALSELLRRLSINATTRRARCDMEFDGITIKTGDHVFTGGFIYGLDPQKWDRPLEVDFDRKPEIMTFGGGIHKCVGMNLARLELSSLLEEWTRRIPKFSITPGKRPITSTGMTLGTSCLPLSW